MKNNFAPKIFAYSFCLFLLAFIFSPSLLPQLKAHANPVVSGTIVDQDTFSGRTVSNAWGTASDLTNSWTLQSGSSSTVSVGGSEGKMASTTVTNYETLGSNTPTDVEGLMRYQAGNYTTDAGRIMLRYSSTSTFYAGGIGIDSSNNPIIDIIKSGTRVYSASLSSPSGFYWIRFRAQTSGTSTILSLKVWQDGTNEPLAWNTQYTDTSSLSAGNVGIRGYGHASSGWAVDNFAIGTISPLPNTPTVDTATDLVNCYVNANHNDGSEIHYNWVIPSGGSNITRVDVSTNSTFIAYYSQTISGGALTTNGNGFLASGIELLYDTQTPYYVRTFDGTNFSPTTSFIVQLCPSGTLQTNDNFQRTVSNSWGTSSNGDAWTLKSGTATTISVGSNTGKMSSTGSTNYLTIGSNSSVTDGEQLMRYSSSSYTTDGGRLLLRYIDANNYYTAGIGVNSGTVVDIIKSVGGIATRETSSTLSATNGQAYWIRFNVTTSGSNAVLSVKVWQDGTVEPSSWTSQWTDTSPLGAGYEGIRGYTGTSSGWKVDSYYSAYTTLPTATPTPIIYSISGHVYNDYNSNATVDTGEPYDKGIKVSLTGAGTGSTTTDANGYYVFSGLANGSYTVTLTTPTGYTATTTNPASDTVSSASVVTDFGIVQSVVTTPTPGLVVSTQTQSGVGGGRPNNQLETDVSWQDGANNGWKVGLIPGYGGALVSPWYQILSGTTSATQLSLQTTISDGLTHFVTDKGGNSYYGTETYPYVLSELDPVGTYFRRFYYTRIPTTGTDTNGFYYNFKEAIYPGDPGFLIQRIDVTNPNGIQLNVSDALEDITIAGLQLVDGTWSDTNGGYGTVGGSTTTGWPSTLTVADPDYFYIIPSGSTLISTGIMAVRETSLSSITGAGTVKIVDSSISPVRLKMAVEAYINNFPANTTYTFYYLQALHKNLTQADATSIAADYLNPDSPTMTYGTFQNFSYEEGLYNMTANASNQVKFLHTISGNVTERWLDIYKIANYTSSSIPTVTLGSTALTSGSDYISYVDTANQIAYVKLLRPIVASGATGNQLNNNTLLIAP